MQIAAGGEFATEFTTAQTNQQPKCQSASEDNPADNDREDGGLNTELAERQHDRHRIHEQAAKAGHLASHTSPGAFERTVHQSADSEGKRASSNQDEGGGKHPRGFPQDLRRDRLERLRVDEPNGDNHAHRGEEQEEKHRTRPSGVVHFGIVRAVGQDDSPHQSGTNHTRQQADNNGTGRKYPRINHRMLRSVSVGSG